MSLAHRVEVTQETISAFETKPFIWGEFDCAHLVRHHLIALGRDDPMAGWREYSSELGALRALKEKGFENLAEAVDALGLERIAPARVLPGDIVAIPADDDRFVALGIYLSQGRVLAALNDGFTWGDRKVAHMAWRAV